MSILTRMDKQEFIEKSLDQQTQVWLARAPGVGSVLFLVFAVLDMWLLLKISINSCGLLGMRERVHYWKGNIDITGIPDRGTTIELSIPLMP